MHNNVEVNNPEVNEDQLETDTVIALFLFATQRRLIKSPSLQIFLQLSA